MIEIKITGPGGVIDLPLAVICKALADAGFDMQMIFPPYDLHDNPGWLERQLADVGKRQVGERIWVVVNSLPWGG